MIQEEGAAEDAVVDAVATEVALVSATKTTNPTASHTVAHEETITPAPHVNIPAKATSRRQPFIIARADATVTAVTNDTGGRIRQLRLIIH